MSEAARVRPGRRKWIAGGGLLVAGLIALAAWATLSPGALSYYRTPTEVAMKTVSWSGPLRVGGRVASGSLHRRGVEISFSLTDGKHVVPVTYRGDVPDTLKSGTDAVAEGRINADGTLVATRVQAKCSSKFVPKERPGDLGKA